jgi:hypothetical protein
MTCKRSVETLALFMIMAATTPARADEDGFKGHYEAGLSLYSSEDYETAIREFQAAYAIRHKPRLLFNIGQSYRSLGNAREALRYYLLYQALESNPKPGLKAELEGYVAQMKAIVAAAERARRAEDHELPPSTRDARPSSATPANEPGPSEPGTSEPGPSEPGAFAATTTLVPPRRPPRPLLFARAPEPKPPVYKRGWFWGVLGGAAATVIVTGLAVGLTVNQGPGYGGPVRQLSF